jgi:hypothetical protein
MKLLNKAADKAGASLIVAGESFVNPEVPTIPL